MVSEDEVRKMIWPEGEGGPRARMHHYLPVSYLKRFTDPKGFLHVLDFQEQKTFKTKPQNVTKIRDFYTAETVERPDDLGAERILSFFEGKAGPIFEQIVRDSQLPLGTDDWLYSCIFIALLDRRLPISREGCKQVADYLMNVAAEDAFGTKERLDATLRRIERDTGQKLNLKFESARQLIDEGCVSADVPQNAQIRMMLEMTTALVPLISRMTPHLLVSEDAEFVTGDCPLAKHNRQGVGLFDIGWALQRLKLPQPS